MIASPLTTVTLAQWLTPAELAERVGKPVDWVLPVLKTLNAQCGGMLLKDICASPRKLRPRWVVSVATLAKIAPELCPVHEAGDLEGPRWGTTVERERRIGR